MAAKSLEEELFDLVNNSGFPFQMAISEAVEKSSRNHGWTVMTGEYPWKHARGASEGYVDLVLRHSNHDAVCAVVECKRVSRDAKWAFLVPKGKANVVARMSVFWTAAWGGTPTQQSWMTSDVGPLSSEAAFCAIVGDENRRTLFENIADSLLPAAEAIGVGEMDLMQPFASELHRAFFYLPVLVTNARLFVIEFNPLDMDMKTGRLPVGALVNTEVPSVRFRKSLATHSVTATKLSGLDLNIALAQANELYQKTILIINSDALSNSLKQLRLTQQGENRLNQVLSAVLSGSRPKGSPPLI